MRASVAGVWRERGGDEPKGGPYNSTAEVIKKTNQWSGASS